MDSNYLDFGSDTDSDGDRMEDVKLDSDDEEERDDVRLLKMLLTKSTNPVSKKVRDVDDFEAEMEAELDKRALEIEAQGGLSHQKSLSRSSSNSSLNRRSPSPSASPKPGGSKRVRFSSDCGDTSTSSTTRKSKATKMLLPAASSADSSSSAGSEQPDKMEVAEAQTSAVKAGSDSLEPEPPKTYDPIYFDSDESEGEDDETKKKKKNKRSFVSNDDLFYDPESDSRDQAWVDSRRRKYNEPKPNPQTPGVKPLPSSDAVLNCPACFTVLCLDCQRHEFYTSQYRAMFVMNCSISKDVTLKVPLKKEPKWKGRRRRKNEDEEQEPNPGHLPSGDEFNPVRCKICTTQVAVYDTEEVYHFFNVLASHA